MSAGKAATPEQERIAARRSSGARRPSLSIGLGVRNASGTVERCVESVLGQDFGDVELVVRDNASDDGTIDTLEGYARADSRVVLEAGRQNIGSHENMAHVLAASRGRLFRWISADDWLEPGCLSACEAALKRRPEAIGVTTGFTIHTPDGATRHEDFRGEFPESGDAARRFERMLWFFQAGDAKYDPIYGVYRLDAMRRSRSLRPFERTDWLLCAELALMGPIVHLPERLAHRSRDYPAGVDRAAFRRRLDPVRGEELRTSPTRLTRELDALARGGGLSRSALLRCRVALLRFWLREHRRVARIHAADSWHRLRAKGA